MQDYEKMRVDISVYYEIRDSKMYGGVGSIGYASSKVSGGGNMIHNDFNAYISEQKKGFAQALAVSVECVRVITEEEYNLNTSDDEAEEELCD